MSNFSKKKRIPASWVSGPLRGDVQHTHGRLTRCACVPRNETSCTFRNAGKDARRSKRQRVRGPIATRSVSSSNAEMCASPGWENVAHSTGSLRPQRPSRPRCQYIENTCLIRLAKGLTEFLFQRGAGVGQPRGKLLKFGEEEVHNATAVIGGVRVLEELFADVA